MTRSFCCLLGVVLVSAGCGASKHRNETHVNGSAGMPSANTGDGGASGAAEVGGSTNEGGAGNGVSVGMEGHAGSFVRASGGAHGSSAGTGGAAGSGATGTGASGNSGGNGGTAGTAASGAAGTGAAGMAGASGMSSGALDCDTPRWATEFKSPLAASTPLLASAAYGHAALAYTLKTGDMIGSGAQIWSANTWLDNRVQRSAPLLASTVGVERGDSLAANDDGDVFLIPGALNTDGSVTLTHWDGSSMNWGQTSLPMAATALAPLGSSGVFAVARSDDQLLWSNYADSGMWAGSGAVNSAPGVGLVKIAGSVNGSAAVVWSGPTASEADPYPLLYARSYMRGWSNVADFTPTAVPGPLGGLALSDIATPDLMVLFSKGESLLVTTIHVDTGTKNIGFTTPELVDIGVNCPHVALGESANQITLIADDPTRRVRLAVRKLGDTWGAKEELGGAPPPSGGKTAVFDQAGRSWVLTTDMTSAVILQRATGDSPAWAPPVRVDTPDFPPIQAQPPALAIGASGVLVAWTATDGDTTNIAYSICR